MRLVSLKCNNCGQNLELNAEKSIAYCPYCGAKLVIDHEETEQVLIEREKTRRKELEVMEEESSRRSDAEWDEKIRQDGKKYDKALAFIGIFFLIFLIGMIIYASAESCNKAYQVEESSRLSDGQIRITISAKDCESELVNDLVDRLSAIGFTNISTVTTERKLFKKAGYVSRIVVNGISDFKANDWFPKTAKITITYYEDS